MPGGDGTGPFGRGAGSGRGMDQCGRGMGRGYGCGMRGRGMGMMARQQTPEEERADLQGLKSRMEEDLKQIQKRLEELK